MLFLVVVVAVAGLLVIFVRARPPGGDGGATRTIAAQVAIIADRLAALEGHQVRVGEGVASTASLAGGLRDATEAIRVELSSARHGLTELQAGAAARREQEEQSARSLRRLEQVIAGTATKGGAGENITEIVFARLPVEWQLRDVRIGNRVVEFALRLPNGLVLPIDCKWPATALLESFLAAEDGPTRLRLKAQLEGVVRARAGEVAKYLDPDLTTGFAIAVVPDAVDELCSAAKSDCLRINVAVIGQGMLLPYLLLVFQTVLRAGKEVDLERLAAHLTTAEQALGHLQEEVEGRLSRSIVMLTNSRDDLRSQAVRVAGSLNAIEAHVPEAAAPEALAGM